MTDPSDTPPIAEKTSQKKPWYKRKWIWAIVIVVIILAAIPTTEDSEPPVAEETGDRSTVRLSLDPEIEGRSLWIRGRTDLPPGAVLSYEVRHEDWDFDHNVPGFAEGAVEVDDGQYEARIDLSGWPSGSIEVWLAFQTMLKGAEQPPSVIEQFGELGERLEGSSVSETGSLKRVELVDTLQMAE